MIDFHGESLQIKFRPPFDLDQYETFLASKKLPESNLSYDWASRTYTLEAPARYARLFGLTPPKMAGAALPPHPGLLDRQLFAVKLALAAKRFAVWYDTGLGKTLIELEFARQVAHMTGGRVLLIVPLNIIPQTLEEAGRFYGDLEIKTLETRDEMKSWCKSGQPGLAISNPEKFIPRDGEEFIAEIQYLAGVVLDESSLLKTGDGKIKWAMIKSCKGIEYKLSCTATPAPNDSMEYASQASFLEKIRNDGEILWTYFSKTKEGDWKIKEHAKAGFYRFLAGWSIYMRNPAAFGFQDDLKDLPQADLREYALDPTPEQLAAAAADVGSAGGQRNLFLKTAGLSLPERIRYGEIAKGFFYQNKKPVRVPSPKPAFVADLARADLAEGRQVLIWSKFDEESLILSELLSDVDQLECLHGRTPKAERAEIIERFRCGRTPLLISKAELLGYGLNFQNCSSMIFSGFDDSYERFYQAMRRCHRYGQTQVVKVHIPYIPDLEGVVWANVKEKEARINSEVSRQEFNYQAALKELLS